MRPAASRSVGAGRGLSTAVAERHGAGDSSREIGRKVGVSRETVRKIVKAHGLDSAANGSYRPAEMGAKIAAAKRGKPRPDQSERLRRRHREQGHSPPEERWCERCGAPIGLVYVSHGTRFCNPSCATLWAWENEPEKFPHAGTSEFPCAICRHRTVKRAPSQIEAAGGPKKCRFICPACVPLWRSAVMRSRMMLSRVQNPRAAWLNGAKEPFRAAAIVAAAFETEVRAASKGKAGRRPPLAADFLIEAAHREGFPDRLVCDALNYLLGEQLLRIPGLERLVFDVAYVTRRRERARIWRGARAA